MRTIIVGDIHGSFGEWECLMETVRFDSEDDRLILIGDIMDRGKDSYKVFCKAVSLQEKMQDRFVLIKGSHEKFLLEENLSLPYRVLWNLIGKREAVRSFKQRGKRMDDCMPWFKEHCVPYYEEENFQCVHAGVTNQNLSKNDDYTLFMDHKCTRRNQYTGKLTITGHVRFKEPMRFDGSGKSGVPLPYNQLLPLPQSGFMCIDTGCAEGNKLTAMVIEGDEYYLACALSARNKGNYIEVNKEKENL